MEQKNLFGFCTYVTLMTMICMRLSMSNGIFGFTARRIQREPKKKERKGEGEGKMMMMMMIMMMMMCTDQLTRPQSSFMLFVSGHGRHAEDY